MERRPSLSLKDLGLVARRTVRIALPFAVAATLVSGVPTPVFADPRIGDCSDGKTFLGGDSGDPANWIPGCIENYLQGGQPAYTPDQSEGQPSARIFRPIGQPGFWTPGTYVYECTGRWFEGQPADAGEARVFQARADGFRFDEKQSELRPECAIPFSTSVPKP